ncbi:sigma 54-interacting transcriptional regulator [Myxococcota bacterium]
MSDSGRLSDPNEPQRTHRLFTSVVAIPRLELVVVRESGQPSGRRVTVDGERVRVGSHPSNEVVLEDRSVSRFHCLLRAGPRGWSITDMGSTNGSLLAGIRVKEADLPRPECELRLGASVVVVKEQGSGSLTRLPEWSQFGELQGESVAMRRVYSVLDRVARTDATVLIEGESGTGKELVAHELVRQGPRAEGPLVAVDTGAIAFNLVESELFGHVRGAFTSADRDRKGAFEAAHGGTLFLDEIGEMPLDLQPKLLRALESREIRRVGEIQPRRVDVRVIAATNRNLEREVNRGRFRGDLYFRLSVVTVRLPPLRERLEDLPLLVRSLLESAGAAEQQSLFPPPVLREMAEHDWPGNVRELRNCVERAVVLGVAGLMGGASIRPSTRSDGDGGHEESNSGLHDFDLEQPFKVNKDRLIARFERAYLERLLTWAEGNVSRAARKAGLDRMHLHRLLQRYELKSRSG